VFYVLLTLLILNGLFLGIIVLLQSGKGGGLASMGGGAGTDTLIGGRQAATLLTKATWASGGVFLALSLVLSLMSSQRQATGPGLLRRELRQTAPPPAATTPQLPGAAPTTTTGPEATTTPQSPPATTTQQ
jgi:preprotein translocase subunit SecG